MNVLDTPYIPLPNVTSKILSMVIEYCKKHVKKPKTDDDVNITDDKVKKDVKVAEEALNRSMTSL